MHKGNSLKSVKLSSFAEIPVTHLRTLPSSENATHLLLKCVKSYTIILDLSTAEAASN